MLSDPLTRRDICLTEQVSLLNCLTAAIPTRERVITCEEVSRAQESTITSDVRDAHPPGHYQPYRRK